MSLIAFPWLYKSVQKWIEIKQLLLRTINAFYLGMGSRTFRTPKFEQFEVWEKTKIEFE